MTMTQANRTLKPGEVFCHVCSTYHQIEEWKDHRKGCSLSLEGKPIHTPKHPGDWCGTLLALRQSAEGVSILYYGVFDRRLLIDEAERQLWTEITARAIPASEVTIYRGEGHVQPRVPETLLP